MSNTNSIFNSDELIETIDSQTASDLITNIIKENRENPVAVKAEPMSAYIRILFNDVNALRIKFSKKEAYISIAGSFQKFLSDYPDLATKQLKSDNTWTRIIMKNTADLLRLTPLFLTMYDESYWLGTYEVFGCCSRYVQCSDSLKCVSHDPKLSRGCMYKRNLLKGKVFYGKNKNV